MLQVALVGPELEENLSLRYLASSLTVPLKLALDLGAPLAENGSVPVKQAR